MRISDWSSDVCSAVLSACGPRQGAQVVSVDRKQIIDADERRIIGEHLLRDHLAAEPLLESVEARGFTPLHLSAHEQFAIDHRILIERRDQFGERPADLLAATAVDARDRKSTRLNSSP